ncbi:MAG: hypothetical protein JWO09_1550 [Bacteroidetes bacterium]|nr:hypothetical protein [Bacteroidota bacterium]
MEKNNAKCCGNVDLSNLGRCRSCIVLSVVLTAICWTGYYLLVKYNYNYWLCLIVLVFAGLFSLLFVAHAIAFFTNKEK